MEQIGSVYLSVVIPVYNESRRLPRTLEEIRPYLDSRRYTYEVLIVDDNSPDGTAQACREISRGWAEMKVLEMQGGRQGKGAGVKKGCLAARGKNILVMDADHPTPIDTLDWMFPLMKDNDMVVGVRTFSGQEGSSGRFRRIVGLMQQLLAHIIVFEESVADSQCGFKLFSREAADIIFPRLRVKGGMYDVEIFLIAQKHQLKIYSKPVKWVNKEGSTINIVRCLLLDPWSLVSIRLMALFGKYH